MYVVHILDHIQYVVRAVNFGEWLGGRFTFACQLFTSQFTSQTTSDKRGAGGRQQPKTSFCPPKKILPAKLLAKQLLTSGGQGADDKKKKNLPAPKKFTCQTVHLFIIFSFYTFGGRFFHKVSEAGDFRQKQEGWQPWHSRCGGYM